MSKKSIIEVRPLGFPWETNDPFLFCAYHKDNYPKGNGKFGPDASELNGRNIGQDFQGKDGWNMYHGETIPGFPSHPHRGFETITIAKEGVVDHSDSLGAAGRFGNGDVQWMTAGKGVQHSEMFPLLNEDLPNHLELFQIWLNLPKAGKFVAPHFSMLWRETIPKVIETDANGNHIEVDVIAGNIDEHNAPTPNPDSWAANTDNEVAVWTIKLAPDAEWKLQTASQEVNRSIYFHTGEHISIDEAEIPVGHSISLDAAVETTIKNGPVATHLLLLQGKPINEPVAKYGPFVMNTNLEIQQAMLDYQETQFGGWPWPSHDYVHPADRKRFALHADGREEIKEAL